METRNVSVSGNTTVPFVNGLAVTVFPHGIDLKDVEESRAFVDKIIHAAQSLKGSNSGEDMVRLAHRIEAVQETLEGFCKEGLSSPEVGQKLLHSIIDMGQTFLAQHKKVCHEAFKKALSSDAG